VPIWLYIRLANTLCYHRNNLLHNIGLSFFDLTWLLLPSLPRPNSKLTTNPLQMINFVLFRQSRLRWNLRCWRHCTPLLNLKKNIFTHMRMFFWNNYNGIASHAVSTSRQRQPFQKSFLCLDGHFKLVNVLFLQFYERICIIKWLWW